MVIVTLLSSYCANAQVDSLVRFADSLYATYRFEEASDLFEDALLALEDSTASENTFLIENISHKRLLAENGRSMSKYVRKPKVSGRQQFSLDDFALYYPVENRSWRTLPNQLDSCSSDNLVQSIYIPDWNNTHYYSAKDENGRRDIYVIERQDTLWTYPRKVEELSIPESNEIYPMLSPDGKTMYFSSDGLYGLGGYDIYYSTWDSDASQWSAPKNMGIPFSSPSDDFLFVDSEDEKYSLFASNRDCSSDSVWVYAIEYERLPLHYTIDDPKEILELAEMKLPHNPVEQTPKNEEHDGQMMLYMTQMDNVRALKDSIDVTLAQIDELRTEMTFSNDESKRYELSALILEMESRVPELQKEWADARAELQKIEFEFLKHGLFLPKEEPDVDVKEEDYVTPYEFVRHTYGDPLNLAIEVPEVKFDYTFKVLDEAVFAEDQTIPPGIIYQIQLFGGSKATGMHAFKGLSPVYEHRSPSGMYIYRVGRFSTYDEAIDKVYTVRELGFNSAYLCAFSDGKEISVANARAKQERLKGGFSLYEIVITPESGELNPAVVQTINSMAIGKDIKRTESEDGTQIFSVGPFDDKEVVDRIISVIKDQMRGTVESISLF